MYKDLVSHQFKQTIRHRSWEKQVATNIFLGLLFALIIMNIMALGFAIDDILETFYPDKDPVSQFTSFILYYVFIDFILRLMIQEVPALSIKPYLIFPIKKSRLMHFLLSKSLWSFFPIIPLLLVIPFAIKILPDHYAPLNIVFWSIGLFVFFNAISYFALYLKRKIHFNPGIIAIVIVCFIIIILLERDQLISISSISAKLFSTPLEAPIFNCVGVAVFILAYFINYQYLRNHTYAEEFLAKQRARKTQTTYGYLAKMGTFGELVALELKLIFRNRRIRSTVFLSIWMVALAWPFYKYYYPNTLEKSPKDLNYIQHEILVPGNNEHIVTIKVIPETHPPLNQVCIAGDHPKFGDWKADKIPLQMNSDSTWTRSFLFKKDTKLQYKITGADWGNEALYEEGIIPDPYKLTVTQDTTIAISVLSWKEDKIFNTISVSMLIYAGIFFIGMFIITYGQFLLAWEAGYFDFLLVKKIDYRKYFYVKVFLLAGTCLVAFLLIAPFLFHHQYAFYSLLVALIYNLGINLPLILFFSLYNRSRIDISAGAFSMQGKSGQKMINVLILILAPAILSGILISNVGIAACFKILGGLGLAGILLMPFTFNLILKSFANKKYIMGAAFREPV
jgi:hypothetical protein